MKLKCYRLNCKEDCNEIKSLYCIYRVTKEQQKLIAKIKHNYCPVCGTKLVKAKYRGERIKLCTECGVRGKVA